MAIAREASVHSHLKVFAELLNDPEVTEIAVNGINSVAYEKASVWHPFDIEYSYTQALNLGTAIAAYGEQKWDKTVPLLSAAVPVPLNIAKQIEGDTPQLRFQLVMPSAVPSECLSITIRKPALFERSMNDFEAAGLFGSVKINNGKISAKDAQLLSLKDNREYKTFLQQCVRERKNIVVAGATGSGKTTFMKTLCNEIPVTERLITIEDVRELRLPHWNKVHLLYSKGRQGSSDVSAKHLLESCLRMKPSRILLAELRGDECLYYIRNAASGHPGSITSVHAETPALAFEQMALLIKDSPGGAFMEMSVIQRLLKLTIDVVVQFQIIDGHRSISEIWFEPEAKIAASMAK